MVVGGGVLTGGSELGGVELLPEPQAERAAATMTWNGRRRDSRYFIREPRGTEASRVRTESEPWGSGWTTHPRVEDPIPVMREQRGRKDVPGTTKTECKAAMNMCPVLLDYRYLLP